MGYFPNGTSAGQYYHDYCSRCVHSLNTGGCAVWNAHEDHGYEECNNKGSILHELIPRSKKGHNLECRMFFPLNILN